MVWCGVVGVSLDGWMDGWMDGWSACSCRSGWLVGGMNAKGRGWICIHVFSEREGGGGGEAVWEVLGERERERERDVKGRGFLVMRLDGS